MISPPSLDPIPRPDASEARYALKWRKTLLLAIPFGAAAFLAGWALEVPSGQATTFDMVAYPVMGFLMLALEGLLALDRRALTTVVIGIIAGASTFFVAKLGWLLFGGHTDVGIQAQLTETFFWIPVVYLLSFVLAKVRAGRYIVVAFTAAVLGLSVAYALPHAMAGTSWGVTYALIELNLANTVLLALTSAFISFKEDYTRTQARMDEAERFAYTDSLTGLPNRPQLKIDLEHRLANARARGTHLAVLFLDIDGFKVINDTVGHEAGDELLRQFAARLQAEIRRGDVFARISGDEFVVLLDDVGSPQTALFVARKLQAALVEPFTLDGHAHHVTASIGACIHPHDADDAATLLQHADAAMYRVKRSGKNGVQRYRDDSDAQVERQRALERELRKALSAGQISLVYQPLHDLGTGAVRKVEALLRWHHPHWGHVSPAEFVPIAERSGLIVGLGEWVLREACRQAKAWSRQSGEDLTVCVNVSPMQFAHPGFYRTVEAALEEHALMPECLELELTEGIVMHGVEHVHETLDRLQRLGVHIAIDDFGTGYSSFAYLRDMPIDTVKIDRSFVRDLGSPLHAPQFALALVEAITHLASHLDLQIVAEGVETDAQRRVVSDLGCHLGQGYYFSKPMPPPDVEPYLYLSSRQGGVTAGPLVN
ncbi:MAG: EAL domain-containing protein [Trueperaceae bacterium]|nr:EAL domain-containing protein [Trueperaceae bacterium]